MSGIVDVHEILCAILRRRWDSRRAVWVESVLSGFAAQDWTRLIDAARSARVAPLLYLHLRDRNLLPPEILDRLRIFYFATARRNLLASHALAQVIEHLNTHGIPNILLKGMALALNLYKNEALRPMGDVDLLVNPSDVPRTLSLLAELGYSAPIPEVRPGARFDYDGELYLRTADQNAAPIDLHWNLINGPLYRRPVGERWLWESAQPIVIGSVEGRILCPEAQLLHLCAHKMLHHHDEDDQGAAALWGYDIAVLLAEYTIDWPTAISKAQALEILSPLQQLVPAIGAEWGVPVPADVLTGLASVRPSRSERQMIQWRASDHKLTGARAVWYKVWKMPNPVAGVRYLWDMVFPSVSYMRDHYGMPHAALLPIYYVRRWLRGVGIGVA